MQLALFVFISLLAINASYNNNNDSSINVNRTSPFLHVVIEKAFFIFWGKSFKFLLVLREHPHPTDSYCIFTNFKWMCVHSNFKKWATKSKATRKCVGFSPIKLNYIYAFAHAMPSILHVWRNLCEVKLKIEQKSLRNRNFCICYGYKHCESLCRNTLGYHQICHKYKPSMGCKTPNWSLAARFKCLKVNGVLIN